MRFKESQEYILHRLRRELPAHLTYHTLAHILDVCHVAEELADSEQVPEADKKLITMAALYHDSGFIHQASEHEERSCRYAREDLPQFGYTPGQIDMICSIIMATRIPQQPHNLLEEILADADLDYLGRDDFGHINVLLYRELLAAGKVRDEEEWHRLQISFLQAHHYWTATAIRERSTAKEAHLRALLQTSSTKSTERTSSPTI